jgi:hypothetical protein
MGGGSSGLEARDGVGVLVQGRRQKDSDLGLATTKYWLAI